jgi:hypothetical protein
MDNPYEEEDDSDEDDTATEDSGNHIATAYKLFSANPLCNVSQQPMNFLMPTHLNTSLRKPPNFYRWPLA